MRRSTMNLETLESRTLLSSDAVGLVNYLESFDGDFGGNRSRAQKIWVEPMLSTAVSGSLANGSDVDMLRVQLEAGQILTADVNHFAGGGPVDLKLTMYDSRAKRVASSNDAIDPVTGQLGSDPALIYRVKKSGSYFLRLSSMIPGDYSMPYEMKVRPIGLNTSSVDRKLLASDASGMYAFLNGDRLAISGPVGHGFEIQGAWKQKTYGSGANLRSKFYVGGDVTLKTVAGDVPMIVPPGVNLSIVTERSPWSDQFGEIASIDWTADLGIAELSKPFNRGFGIAIGDLSVNQPQTAWGIRLGSDPLLANTGLPLNPAVPYLQYLDNHSFDASFGGASVSSAVGYSAGIVVDPSDSLFISAKANGLGEFAAGVSYHGLIPYTPAARPSHFSAEVYGNIYAKLGVDISAFAPTVPLSVDGAVTIDLDANDDGKNLGGAKLNINQLLSNGFNSQYLGKQVARVFSDVDIAVNGNARVGYQKAGFDFSLPVGNGSLIYRAKQQAVFARGRTVNPFAGTPLAVFGSRNSLDIDGYAYRTGAFNVTADGTYTPGLYTMTGKMTLNNNGVRANGKMTALGTNVNVSGNIAANGNFTLSGTARASFGPISGNGNFKLANSNGRVSFNAAMSSGFSTDIGPVHIGGNLSFNASIGVSSGGLTYAGSGSATLSVAGVSIGPAISISNRELAFHVKVTPIIDEWIRIPMPG